MDDSDDLFAAPAAPTASVRELAAQGLTDHEIAARTGMTVDAVRAHPDVLGAWTEAHDERVMRALYAAAVGGETWTDKLDKFGDVHRLAAQLPPDPKAALDWLRARRREQWGAQGGEASRVYVVALPMVAGNAGDWLQAIERERAVIEHRADPGGRSGAGGGVERK